MNMISTSYSRAVLQTETEVHDGRWKDLAVKRIESRFEVNLNGKLHQTRFTVPGRTTLRRYHLNLLSKLKVL